MSTDCSASIRAANFASHARPVPTQKRVTLEITVAGTAVAALVVMLGMTLHTPWQIETIRSSKRDTAAVVSLALPSADVADAMHAVMISMPQAEFGIVRRRAPADC
jgi:hypothetical protein